MIFFAGTGFENTSHAIGAEAASVGGSFQFFLFLSLARTQEHVLLIVFELRYAKLLRMSECLASFFRVTAET